MGSKKSILWPEGESLMSIATNEELAAFLQLESDRVFDLQERLNEIEKALPEISSDLGQLVAIRVADLNGGSDEENEALAAVILSSRKSSAAALPSPTPVPVTDPHKDTSKSPSCTPGTLAAGAAMATANASCDALSRVNLPLPAVATGPDDLFMMTFATPYAKPPRVSLSLIAGATMTTVFAIYPALVTTTGFVAMLVGNLAAGNHSIVISVEELP